MQTFWMLDMEEIMLNKNIMLGGARYITNKNNKKIIKYKLIKFF